MLNVCTDGNDVVIKTEADIDDITESLLDDQTRAGMTDLFHVSLQFILSLYVVVPCAAKQLHCCNTSVKTLSFDTFWHIYTPCPRIK